LEDLVDDDGDGEANDAHRGRGGPSQGCRTMPAHANGERTEVREPAAVYLVRPR